MMKMINKRRVQRIKNLIYVFIVLILFLPIILISILSFQMFGAIKDLNAKVDTLSKIAASQTDTSKEPDASSAPDSGYVIEPDMQASNPADNPDNAAKQEDEGLGLEPDEEPGEDSFTPSKENLSVFPNNGSPNADIQSEEKPLPADGGSELGGGAPIDGAGDEYLAASDADASKTADKELAANPQTGYSDDVPPSDYTANPSTGA